MSQSLLEQVAALRARIEATPFAANIGAFVDEAAARNGDNALWTFFEDGRTATYAEAKAAIDRMAEVLHHVGVRQGAHVAVMLPNVPEFPTTWLALARLGAIMVPVNIGYTPRELHYVLTDSEATFLVVDQSCLATVRAMEADTPVLAAATVVVVGGDGSWGRPLATLLAEAPARSWPWPAPQLDDLMNIQYTSGTTGFPKGCMLTHRYWLTIGKVAAMRGSDECRRILAAQPYYYMDPQWLTLMAMYSDGQIFVARRASSSRFMDWVRAYDIEYCLFPGVMNKEPESPLDRRHKLKRVSIFGLPKEAHAALEARFGVVARESFGMTEVGSALFMPREATHMVGSGSCGLPSPYREAKICDEQGDEVPVGEIGELCIRGPGILKGYYRKPEANAAAFRDGWFRTGDLFRKDAQGFHYIVGRVKDMIRRSGENIAAREVEAVLKEIPEVADAAAVGVRDERRGQEVKAYVVLKPGFDRDAVPPERIFAHCATGLAKFKVPRYLEYRETLPRTPSEKIAKQRLVDEKPDLRADSYDRVDGVWR
ncbi:MAG: AMP-binding protein [Alphaproteobacteria bacterium]|nr:AMP-binding protein [Alphaproteobacteria bacterium]